MKDSGGCTRSRRFSYLARRCHRPRSAVLSLMLLGLSIGTSNAQTTTASQPREHVYLLRGFANVFSLGMEQLGVPVKLAIGLDPTSRMTTTGHVDRYINYYIANGFGDPVDRGQGFSGALQNVDLEHMAGVGHFNIDKNNVLQGMVIRDILTAVSASPLRAPVTCDPYSGKSCGSPKHGAVTEGTIGSAGR